MSTVLLKVLTSRPACRYDATSGIRPRATPVPAAAASLASMAVSKCRSFAISIPAPVPSIHAVQSYSTDDTRRYVTFRQSIAPSRDTAATYSGDATGTSRSRNSTSDLTPVGRVDGEEDAGMQRPKSGQPWHQKSLREGRRDAQHDAPFRPATGQPLGSEREQRRSLGDVRQEMGASGRQRHAAGVAPKQRNGERFLERV